MKDIFNPFRVVKRIFPNKLFARKNIKELIVSQER
jgi:hypothetical protein